VKKMKLLVICALLFAPAALADERPIYEFPEWWVNRDFDPSPLIKSRFREGRIIGGQEATPNQFPYQVGLRLFIQNSNNVGLCGGSLVSANRIVSAAHCVDIVSGLEAVMGAHFLNRFESTQARRTVPLPDLVWHENYNPRTLTNDVAIITLLTPVTLNNFIQVVRLPEGADLNNDFAGSSAVASGWGRFSEAQASSEFLRFVNVNVISNTACRIRFPTIIQESTSKYHKDRTGTTLFFFFSLKFALEVLVMLVSMLEVKINYSRYDFDLELLYLFILSKSV
jgi:Trypsin